ncbi:hypothetical protein Tco_0707733, partial [Tanacetum coccineum]
GNLEEATSVRKYISLLRHAIRSSPGENTGTARPESTRGDSEMAPKKRTTRASPATKTTTTSVTNAQLKALIDKGVADALAARDADKSMNGDDSYNSRTGVRRNE